ncbi:MAG: right-handed parallel beta-helix repeat-containing protein, partial [Nanoarchaeota archaeon]
SGNDGISSDVAQNFNNTIANNTIRTFGTSSDNPGISLTNAGRNMIVGNVIITNGTAISHGILLSGSSNSTFENNVINTSGVGSYGIHITTSNTTQFINNTLFDTSQWIFSPISADTNNTFINTTFRTSDTSVRFSNFTTTARYNLTHSVLNLGHNAVSFNASNISFMNGTAQLTFNGIAFISPQVIVDIDDDGTFVACPSDVCDPPSYISGTVVTNVTHFTNYSTREGPIQCGSINQNVTLSEDINSTGDCLTLTESNIVIDCAGFEINYSQGSRGHGIVASGLNNITIKNCSIVNDFNNLQTAAHGINLTNVNHSFVLANNVTVDGDQSAALYLESVVNTTFRMNWINTTGTGSQKFGIRITTNAHNNTVSNNTVHTQGTGNLNVGIRVESTAFGNLVSHNVIVTNGTTSNYGIFLQTSASNNTLANNTIQTRGSGGSNYGVYLFDAVSDTTVQGNIIDTNGTDNDYGVFLQSTTTNNTIANNTIRTGGTGGSNLGVYMSSTANDNVLRGNVVQTGGTSANQGVRLQSVGANSILNNSIVAGGSAGSNFGILFILAAGSHVSGNSIIANGTDSNDGIFLQSSSDNITFVDNNISAFGSGSYALVMQSSNGSLFNNTIMSAVQWLRADTATNHTFFNTSFVTTNATVRFNGRLNATGPFNVTHDKFNPAFNSVFLNSTNVSFMNASARITFNGINFARPIMQVDIDDDGSFAQCGADVCTQVSYGSGIFVMDVAHFTNYTLSDSVDVITTCPVLLNRSSVLTGNININFTHQNESCIIFNNDSITLDCDGYTIRGNRTGLAINATNHANITLANCTLTNWTRAVLLDNTTDSRLQNLVVNITSLPTWLRSGSHNTNVTNSTFRSGSAGGVLIEDSRDMRIFDNRIWFNSLSGLNMQRSNGSFIVFNNISQNTGSGVVLNDSQSTTVENNSMLADLYGVEIPIGRDILVRNNEVVEPTQMGVSTGNTALPFGQNITIVNNNITDASTFGVSAFRLNSTTIMGNRVLITGLSGILVQEVSASLVAGNRINDTAETGVYIFRSNNSRVENNTFSNDDLHGIDVADAYSVNVSNNTLIDVLFVSLRAKNVTASRFSNNIVYTTGTYGAYWYNVNGSSFENNTINGTN